MFVYIKARFLSKVGYFGSKIGHKVKSQKILVNTLEATFLTQPSLNLVRMFVYIKSRFLSKVGHFGSKTKSLGQILDKPCEHNRDHIFDPIFIKYSQNVCLHKSSVPFKSGSFRVKNQVARSNLKNNTCEHSRGHIFYPIFIKLGQNVCLHKSLHEFESRSFLVNN